jgi:hypothetical protein
LGDIGGQVDFIISSGRGRIISGQGSSSCKGIGCEQNEEEGRKYGDMFLHTLSIYD